jgi:hypothetical protein
MLSAVPFPERHTLLTVLCFDIEAAVADRFKTPTLVGRTVCTCRRDDRPAVQVAGTGHVHAQSAFSPMTTLFASYRGYIVADAQLKLAPDRCAIDLKCGVAFAMLADPSVNRRDRNC